jgi:hypothetical protein
MHILVIALDGSNAGMEEGHAVALQLLQKPLSVVTVKFGIHRFPS